MAESFMVAHPDTIAYATDPKSGRWTYEQGVMLESLIQLARATGNSIYWDYVKRNIDLYVRADDRIDTYQYDTFNLDNIATGRALLALYNRTHEPKYKIAADTLRKQLANQPRTPSGGFWHKEIYPNQMWLDGLYMAEAFYAEYAGMFDEPSDYDDIAHQFILIESHTRDAKTGLLYHAWDESKRQRWADSVTGTSPHFWSRAMGWYAWALVDVLDYFPADHPKRSELVRILQRLADALLKFRDEKSGLWYQVVDQGRRQGNYLEASGSCMFVYALAKGADKGYLDKTFRSVAIHSFKGIIDSLVTFDDKGRVNLNHACRGAGLGGNPYRDGSYEYYVAEKQRTNDFKAVGPFILAALELEKGASK
jgi:unsaturated rhamnogalacturonyl hydrolase